MIIQNNDIFVHFQIMEDKYNNFIDPNYEKGVR